jgi:hypothetical protein
VQYFLYPKGADLPFSNPANTAPESTTKATYVLKDRQKQANQRNNLF